MLSRVHFLAGSAALLASVARPAEAAPLREIPLLDQDGQPFTLSRLGAPTAVTFIATRCTDTCPIAEALFSQLDRALAARGIDARLLLITLDAAFDQVPVMAARAAALGARAPRFRLATGRPHDIAAVLTAFDVTVVLGPDGIPDAHSTFVFVLNAHGTVQRAIPLGSNAGAELLSALRFSAR